MTKMIAMANDRVADVLFGKTRRGVLALLFGRPEESFYLREIARRTEGGIGAVQRELAQLVSADLVCREPRGNQVWFRANPLSPVYDELRSLMAKTAGIADVLRSGLADLAAGSRIEIAFVYGSVASGTQSAGSDVDLMVIGDVALAELLPALTPLQERLGREITPTTYRSADFRSAYARREHFVRRVLEGPKIMIVGTADELTRVVGEPVAG